MQASPSPSQGEWLQKNRLPPRSFDLLAGSSEGLFVATPFNAALF